MSPSAPTTKALKTLVVDRFDLEALALLKSCDLLDVKTSAGTDPAPQDLNECEALLIRSRTKVNSSLLRSAPRLKVVITATSGFDHIDFAATAERGVVVMNTPEANAASACELTWGLIFAVHRKLLEAHRAVKSGEWRREPLVGSEINGKTLGIVGLGRIGSRVANVGKAFGCRIIAFDPYIEDEAFARAGAQRVAFDELLRLADIVTFHVPASDETQLMLTAQHLEAMNRHAVLINASRGAIVAERDLVQALNEKWIAGLGLDVFEREPLPRDSKLLSAAGVVLTPHIGAATHEAFAAASREAAEKLITFARDGSSSDRLPPEAPWSQSSFAKPLF